MSPPILDLRKYYTDYQYILNNIADYSYFKVVNDEGDKNIIN
jgi:hypothetical protein